MSTKETTKQRLPLLSWLLVPLLLVWIGTNYILGTLKSPTWSNTSSNQTNGDVLGADYDQTISPQTAWKWNGHGVVTLWFDDAWLTQYTNAFPLMVEHNFKGAVAVPTKSVGFDAYMNWTQIKRLQYDGWEISVHSRTHNCDFVNGDKQIIDNEILGSKEDLKSHGLSHDIYVAPCGKSSDYSNEVVLKNFVAARNVNRGYNTLPLQNLFDLKIQAVEKNTTVEEVKTWIEEAKKTNSWLIIMFHQVDNVAEEYGTTISEFSKILSAVQESKLEVVLPSQVINTAR